MGETVQENEEPDEQVGLESTRTFRLAIILCVISLGFLLADFLLASMFESESGIIPLNLVVAQLTLICVWGTLVEGTFWVRIPWTLLLLVISWGALVGGARWDSNWPLDSATVLALGLIWFFGFVVSFVPLKIAAWLFRWRIKHANHDASDGRDRYAIRDMMIGTAMLALVLAIGKAWVPGDLPSWKSVLAESGLDRSETVIILVIFSVVSLVVKLPCIWIALAMKKGILKLSFYWTIASGIMGLIEFVMLCAALGPPGSDMSLLFYLAVGHMCMAASMLGVLCILRVYGYTMHRVAKAGTREVVAG